MKIDFFVGILIVFVGLVIISWVAQPDFALKNPGAANFLGFTSSNVKTTNTKTNTSSTKVIASNSNTAQPSIKIIGASVSFEGEYSQIALRVNINSRGINLSQYILKTSNGTYSLPAINAKAGDYILLTSAISPDGSVTRKVSPDHYEVFISQKFLSLNNETAELYNSAGVLVSRYTYGLSALFQGELGKEVLLPS